MSPPPPGQQGRGQRPVGVAADATSKRDATASMSGGGDVHAPPDAGPAAPMDLRVRVADGVRLHVRHRPGTRPPAFVLVHGLASNVRLWDGVADRLSIAGHQVSATDLRGHGASDTPDGGYDNATVVADIATVVTAIGVSDAVVVGHSWGGNLAVRLAAEHPSLVAALGLVDGGWINPAGQFPTWDAFVAALRLPELDGVTAQSMRAYLRAAHPDWSPAAIDAAMADMRIGPDGSLSRRVTLARQVLILRSMWDDPPQRWYSAVAAPALLLAAIPETDGRRTHGLRTEVSAAAAALRHATVHEYIDGDHDLHAQHPDRVADNLLEFTGALGLRRRAPR